MKSPYSRLLKATRMARKGRPLAALQALQSLLVPDESRKKAPSRGKKRAASVDAKPAAPARSSTRSVPRPPPGSFIEARFACEHGELAYRLYTPLGSARRKLPLLVMLHGCGQSTTDFATGTAMNRVADELGFLVLYPEQSRAANLARCWNWHRPRDQAHGRGEPAMIAALTGRIVETSRADPTRVYIAGLSAGGAAAALIGAAYPELFVAVGVHSGLLCRTVSSTSAAIAAMRDGSVRPTSDAPTSRAAPTILFHGDRDRVVNPANARAFVDELLRATPTGLTAQTDPGRSPGGRAYTRTIYRSGREVRLESWTVHDSGHGWSGGSVSGTYTDPAGPDASREMARFFLAFRRSRAGTGRTPKKRPPPKGRPEVLGEDA